MNKNNNGERIWHITDMFYLTDNADIYCMGT